MGNLSFTILGCGSSGGVPRLGGTWGDCDPSNTKNQRSRCSLLVERKGSNGVTTVLIDTSPDMRSQLLKANVGKLDGVVIPMTCRPCPWDRRSSMIFLICEED